MKLRPWVKITLVIIGIILIFVLFPNIYDKVKSAKNEAAQKIQDAIKAKEQKKKEEELEKKRQEKLEKEYQACLIKPYDKETEKYEIVETKDKELGEYIKSKYSLSLKYEDITTGFDYYYYPNESHYAASTIKLLDALFIYTKAANKEIDLEATITYNSSDVYNDSTGMEKHHIGDKVSIRNLVKYAVIYSDNSAHQMLIKNIGFNNLKSFGNSLGATSTLVGGDNFGNITATDGIIYLKEVYKFIEEHDELGKELKGYLLKAEENGLKYDGLSSEVGHKYGYYKNVYNDLGIIYDEHPYVIAVLTNHGLGDYKAVTKDISQKINELHQSFYKARQEDCLKIKNEAN